jgi:GT2 family glycosyltransferase
MTVLILSNTVDVSYYNLLENCINSIGDYPIIVVETNSKLKDKQIPLANKCKFIFPEEEFNYNKFLNIGISHIKDDKFIISNNDVVYSKDSIRIIEKALDQYDSVSPFDYNNQKHNDLLDVVIGYDIGTHITGCCIGLTRETYETIGKFDEQFSFWYQDNDYADQLKKHILSHAFIKDAKITHIGFKSHELLGDKLYQLTHGLETLYTNKLKSNENSVTMSN